MKKKALKPYTLPHETRHSTQTKARVTPTEHVISHTMEYL